MAPSGSAMLGACFWILDLTILEALFTYWEKATRQCGDNLKVEIKQMARYVQPAKAR
jgi:hypothetical protein